MKKTLELLLSVSVLTVVVMVIDGGGEDGDLGVGGRLLPAQEDAGRRHGPGLRDHWGRGDAV